MSITPSKQTSVYRQVDAIMKTEDIYGGDKYPRGDHWHRRQARDNSSVITGTSTNCSLSAATP